MAFRAPIFRESHRHRREKGKTRIRGVASRSRCPFTHGTRVANLPLRSPRACGMRERERERADSSPPPRSFSRADRWLPAAAASSSRWGMACPEKKGKPESAASRTSPASLSACVRERERESERIRHSSCPPFYCAGPPSDAAAAAREVRRLDSVAAAATETRRPSAAEPRRRDRSGTISSTTTPSTTSRQAPGRSLGAVDSKKSRSSTIEMGLCSSSDMPLALHRTATSGLVSAVRPTTTGNRAAAAPRWRSLPPRIASQSSVPDMPGICRSVMTRSKGISSCSS
mmetsp:Transcript_19444/g.45275  ORF Transcript_19444/g.45275 Transcript_19444/m.45275 type:complete len:286 (-) Transcript_19444:1918-2775(-)